MDTITSSIEIPTVAGTPFAGGFYAGRIEIGGSVYAIVVAPKADGEHKPSPWSVSDLSIPTGNASFYEGLANTEAMAGAENPLAKWARDLTIGGFTDWYIPARDELEICYRALKPTNDENYCWRGDNPSSVPVGYAYMPSDPAQTVAAAFQEGGAEAFETEWYWSSTQYAGYESYAWVQYFYGGYQLYDPKSYDYHARAVRRVLINSVAQ